MSQDNNARINNIPGGWTFEAYLDAHKTLFINVMNRTNTSVEVTIALRSPTAENLKDIGTAFMALAAKI